MTDENKYAKIRYMISYEKFSQHFNNGEITKLHFTYESKEYLIAREEGEDGTSFVFASERHEPVRYPSAVALLKYAIIGGRSLREVWYHISLICNNTLLDDDYVLTRYSDSLGKITHSVSGTLTAYDRYETMRLVPSLLVWVIAVVVLLLCTLFIPELSWTFFAIAASISVSAFGIAQLIFWSNTKKYRHGNPCAHLYLLDYGVVILTNRTEYVIPYTKILRLNTEAGICITTMMTVFIFVANEDADISATLRSSVNDMKANRHHKNTNQTEAEKKN